MICKAFSHPLSHLIPKLPDIPLFSQQVVLLLSTILLSIHFSDKKPKTPVLSEMTYPKSHTRLVMQPGLMLQLARASSPSLSFIYSAFYPLTLQKVELLLSGSLLRYMNIEVTSLA